VNQDLSYGGQAVIEGVMIRSPRFISVACRLPDGRIDVQTEEIKTLFQRQPWLRQIPLVRGVLALFEMLALGLKTLERSANLQLVEPLGGRPGPQGVVWRAARARAGRHLRRPASSPAARARGLRRKQAARRRYLAAQPPPAVKEEAPLSGWAMLGTLAFAFALGAVLFVALPNLLAGWLGVLLPNKFWLNAAEGLIRLAIFVGYIGVISTLPAVGPEVRRVFAYHGAEHKVVNAFEAGQPLSLGSIDRFGTIHPRCGTNFAFIVIVISILAFSLLPWNAWYWRILSRLVLLPMVAGIGYEVVQLAGKNPNSALMRFLIGPGLLLQRLTTREPDEVMVEVARRSFWAVWQAEETGRSGD